MQDACECRMHVNAGHTVTYCRFNPRSPALQLLVACNSGFLPFAWTEKLDIPRPLNTTQDRRNVLLDNRVGDNEIISKNAGLLSLFWQMPMCQCYSICEVTLTRRFHTN